MKLKIKALLFALLTLGTVGLLTGCAADPTPYEVNNKDGYTVSVKYDANGGVFTTNTTVIVDSFNVSDVNKNGDGNAEVALIAPDNELRGGTNTFTATKAGYFLAGWYAQRTQTGTDSEGNPIYTYGDRWDFEKDKLEVDTSKTYTAEEPVMTLYAAWVPMFEVDIFSLTDGELLTTYVVNPLESTEIQIPKWNEETGKLAMYDFPTKMGYTMTGVYYDAAGKKPVTDAVINHVGEVDYETATATKTRMKLFVDWAEGEWYHIYTAEQLVDNASVVGNYVICADLDFTDQAWPTSFMHGNFGGTIVGNGHVFKNVTAVQTDNSKTNTGLFGNLAENANVSNITFENPTLILEGGNRIEGARIGLFAGMIAEEATISDIKILNGSLKISSKCFFDANMKCNIGLLTAFDAERAGVEAQISCEATGEKPENVHISVDENTVTVEIVTGETVTQ